MIINYFKI